MIAAISWIVSAIVRRRKQLRNERGLARAITSIKSERYDLNPAMARRQRIPKVGAL